MKPFTAMEFRRSVNGVWKEVIGPEYGNCIRFITNKISDKETSDDATVEAATRGDGNCTVNSVIGSVVLNLAFGPGTEQEHLCKLLKKISGSITKKGVDGIRAELYQMWESGKLGTDRAVMYHLDRPRSSMLSPADASEFPPLLMVSGIEKKIFPSGKATDLIFNALSLWCDTPIAVFHDADQSVARWAVSIYKPCGVSAKIPLCVKGDGSAHFNAFHIGGFASDSMYATAKEKVFPIIKELLDPERNMNFAQFEQETGTDQLYIDWLKYVNERMISLTQAAQQTAQQTARELELQEKIDLLIAESLRTREELEKLCKSKK